MHDFVGTRNSWWKANMAKVHVKTTSFKKTAIPTDEKICISNERRDKRIKWWKEFNIFAYEIRSLTAFLATLPIRVLFSFYFLFNFFYSIIFIWFLRGSAISFVFALLRIVVVVVLFFFHFVAVNRDNIFLKHQNLKRREEKCHRLHACNENVNES